MSLGERALPTAEQLVEAVQSLIAEAVESAGGDTTAKNPGHRIPFHWPPHPVSYNFHVLASDWDGRTSFQHDGETFDVEVAKTPNGVFGRCPKLWHEAKGTTLEEMLANLEMTAAPLFARQKAITACLQRKTSIEDHFRSMPPTELLRLLYCADRDVANDARIEIETHASLGVFGPALIHVLEDRRHPLRRSAQWCVLDIFEDLPRICPTPELKERAIAAMKSLLWDAEDDYARTVYKAGVVLGGHVPGEHGGPVLMECLDAPSKIGRRSAIHGLFHVVEWSPETRDTIVERLRAQAQTDTEPLLREFAAGMANDIEEGRHDHVQEPIFPEER